jgi:hypothetical protein
MSVLGRKSDVTHLNFGGGFSMIPGDELRSLRPFPNYRTRRTQDSLQTCCQVWGGRARSPFQVSSAVYLHGVCPAYIQRWFARHRHLPQCSSLNSLSPWLHREGCQIDTCGSQQIARLEDLGGPCKRTYSQGKTSVSNSTTRFMPWIPPRSICL